jgi:hypothetical protein
MWALYLLLIHAFSSLVDSSNLVWSDYERKLTQIWKLFRWLINLTERFVDVQKDTPSQIHEYCKP